MRIRYRNRSNGAVYRYINVLEFSPDLAQCVSFDGKTTYVKTERLVNAFQR